MYNRLIVSILSIAALFWLEGIFPHFQGRKQRIQHALPNVVLACVNGITSSILFAGLTLASIHWAKVNYFGILHFIHKPFYVEAVLGFILFDLWMYTWHFANHRILFLWRFHRMHHSDSEMDNTTALRFHPVEIVFSSLIRLAVIPLLGIDFLQLLIYEITLQPIILFHHSNIGLPERWDQRFRSIIVTPNMHRVHHSQEGVEFNSNYSSVFSFWDRIFGTFRKRDDTLNVKFGLRILQEPKWQSLWGMLLTPFK